MQCCFSDIVVLNSENPEAIGLEHHCPVVIVFDLPLGLVHVAVDFEDQAEFMAVEINDEAQEEMLAPELQSQYLSAAQ